jgi:hypothetical protein
MYESGARHSFSIAPMVTYYLIFCPIYSLAFIGAIL